MGKRSSHSTLDMNRTESTLHRHLYLPPNRTTSSTFFPSGVTRHLLPRPGKGGLTETRSRVQRSERILWDPGVPPPTEQFDLRE